MRKTKYFDPVNYTLQECDIVEKDFSTFLNNLTDVPESLPFYNLSLDEVGITNQQIIVSIKDILGEGRVVPVLCDLSLSVRLSKKRGIHMSRIEEALFENTKVIYDSFDDFGLKLSQNIRNRQDCDYVIVKIRGTYFHSRETIVTKRNTNDKLYLIVNIINTDKDTKIQNGIQAYNMTSCPCTKTYTKFSVVPELKKMSLNIEQIQKIINITHSGSHTQRGLVTIIIDKISDNITFKSLYEILDNSCHLVSELLKRPDEHNLVISALKQPQFTEDVVRDIVYQSLNKFKDVPDSTNINIESLLFDSIHIHDVCAKINKTFGEIRKEIKK